MVKLRLDTTMVNKGLVTSRSQAENYIKLGYVSVDGHVATKAGQLVNENSYISVSLGQQYVSRAALKLASVTEALGLSFKGKVILDVGSSTGGFTDYVLQNGAKKVIAVDVGTKQLHDSLRTNLKVELHEQTDIRDVKKLSAKPDIIVIDVSFISLRKILPHIARIVPQNVQIVPMVKPQFEAQTVQKNRGVIKNERLRRDILKDFENWTQKLFVIVAKADSQVTGQKGNRERFYLLKKAANG